MSLRPTVFATNFFGMWAPQIKAGDVVSGPYAAASTAPIVDRDISAVAVHALLTDELLGQKVPLTGPQALTNTELVGVIGTVLGRRLRYQEVPPELVRQRFIGLGFPAAFADAYMAFLSRRRSPGPHWSPTRWRRSWAAPRRASATRLPRIATCSPTSKGDKTCRNYAHPDT